MLILPPTYSSLKKSTIKFHKNPGESIGFEFTPGELKLFRTISETVSKSFQVILKQSEKRFVSRFKKKCQKSIQLNPI